MLSTIGDGQDLVENGWGAWLQLHFLQQLGEATLARLPPTLDFFQDAGEPELRQVQAQRFQHADEDRLPPSTYQSLVRAPRLARRGRATQRAFCFVVRAGR